jgi:RimJ/RimL family protein N-acetyltransferase
MAAMPEVLEASPLILVRWRPEDADEVLEAVEASFAELQQWMDWAQTLPTGEQQREILAEGNAAFDAGTSFGFVFREAATGTLVGGGGVHRRVGPGAVEIGYWVRTDRHNRGYATRATESMTNAVFDCLADVDRIEIHMDCANIASARIPEKLGYRLLHTEQRERLALAHTGEAFVWQTTRAEWTAYLSSIHRRDRCGVRLATSGVGGVS